MVGRHRHIPVDRAEHLVNTLACLGRHLDDWNYISCCNSRHQSVIEFFFCKRLIVEELLHQSLIRTCNRFVENILIIIGNYRVAELLSQLRHYLVNVYVIFINLGEDYEFRILMLAAFLPRLLGSYLYSRGCIHHDNR